jgi:hypothetical protein
VSLSLHLQSINLYDHFGRQAAGVFNAEHLYPRMEIALILASSRVRTCAYPR